MVNDFPSAVPVQYKVTGDAGQTMFMDRLIIDRSPVQARPTPPYVYTGSSAYFARILSFLAIASPLPERHEPPGNVTRFLPVPYRCSTELPATVGSATPRESGRSEPGSALDGVYAGFARRDSMTSTTYNQGDKMKRIIVALLLALGLAGCSTQPSWSEIAASQVSQPDAVPEDSR